MASVPTALVWLSRVSLNPWNSVAHPGLGKFMFRIWGSHLQGPLESGHTLLHHLLFPTWLPCPLTPAPRAEHKAHRAGNSPTLEKRHPAFLFSSLGHTASRWLLRCLFLSSGPSHLAEDLGLRPKSVLSPPPLSPPSTS